MSLDQGPPRTTKQKQVLRGVHYFARLTAIVSCIFAIYSILMTAHGKYKKGELVQAYNSTASADHAKLAITICPVPPFNPYRASHFGHYITLAHRKKLTKLAMEDAYRYDRSGHFAIDCLVNGQFIHWYDSVETAMQTLGEQLQCSKLRNGTIDPDLNETLTNNYFYAREYAAMAMMQLEEERDIEDHPGVYKYLHLLEHDNASLVQFLEKIGTDLKFFVASDFREDSGDNLNGPAQRILMEKISTRFAPKCQSYKLDRSQRTLHQRYELRMTSMRTRSMSLLIFINGLNEFADLPFSSKVLPFRVPMDKNTVIHVQKMERTITKYKGCYAYKEQDSRQLCIHRCLVKKIVKAAKENVCLVPWMYRTIPESQFAGLQYCTSNQNMSTMHSASRQALQKTGECRKACPLECDGLRITVNMMGTTKPSHIQKNRRTTVTIYVSNILDTYKDTLSYDEGQFISEVLGALSFMLGIAFVAAIDWVIATLLWICGKMPFIPSMPPLINVDIYPMTIYHFLKWELFGHPLPQEIYDHLNSTLGVESYLYEHPTYASFARSVESASQHKRALSHQPPGDDGTRTAARYSEGSRYRMPFPRPNQRKSSLEMMTQTFSAVTHEQTNDEFAKQQFSTGSADAAATKDISQHILAIRKRRSVPADMKPRVSRAERERRLSKSYHGMPALRQSPTITVSLPEEEAGGSPAPGAGGLPAIGRKRRPSRARSMLQQLEETAAPPPEQGAPSGERRRSSLYRSRPRRMTQVVVPAEPSVGEEHDTD